MSVLNNNTLCETKIDTIVSKIDNNSFYLNVSWEKSGIKEILTECIEFLSTKEQNLKYLNDIEIVNLDNFTEDILSKLPKQISKNQLYYYIADYFANKIKNHFIFDYFASYYAVKRLHETTNDKYNEVINELYHNKDRNNNDYHLINEELYMTVLLNKKEIQKKLDYSRDYLLDFFAIRTLERSYLLRTYNKKNINTKAHDNDKEALILERPQHLFMRVALAMWGGNLERVFETYDNLSLKYFTHATPTLFNSGTNRQQMSSCFLLGVGDNIEGIFKTITNTAYISKWAGGIGIHLTAIRAKGSLIRGTNGRSDGIIPLCVLLEKEGRYINQGGKRNGSIAIYLEPWHADVFDFIELRQPNGDENMRARDLFLALWTPDIFMKRVLEDGVWSLMCPDQCPGLVDSHGDSFEKLYLRYEQEGKFIKQVKAMDLWNKIIECQIQSGMPYLLYKDHANNKSNQQNLGTIRSSNLCAEVIEYSDDDEIAVCNLASICLPQFINYDENNNPYYNFNKLMEISSLCTRNLNRIIDINYYPVQTAKSSNAKNRPIGIGIQGLVDVYNIFGYSFGSDEAKLLNKKIFETIYYGALKESNELAKEYGPYETFTGSPMSEGKLQYHLWGIKDEDLLMGYNWKFLAEDIKINGVRNSLLTALMPTASTAQIMGNCESFEPYHSNIFVRETLAGEFIVVNKNLMRDLIKEGIWSEKIRKKIIIDNGSIQNISEIPQKYKDIYKTAFEIKLKDIIDQSADRGIFIDQSQSLNLFMGESDRNKLHSAHIHSWKRGLKTAMYYLRSKPATDPINFGLDIEEIKELKKEMGDKKEKICKWRPGVKLSECDMCSA
jgi:ribonucleoside-diphosphate reductase alpha chain